MPQVSYYSPAARQLEKERQRASDEAQLRAGAISQHDLRGRNGFFSSLEIIGSSVLCQEVFA